MVHAFLVNWIGGGDELTFWFRVVVSTLFGSGATLGLGLAHLFGLSTFWTLLAALVGGVLALVLAIVFVIYRILFRMSGVGELPR